METPAADPVPALPTEAERTAACRAEIEDVLRKHGCAILPRVSFEQVGQASTGKFLMTAEYGVVAVQP